MGDYGLQVDGLEVPATSRDRREVHDPSTGTVWATVAEADSGDVSDAVAAAQAVADAWAATPASERAERLRELAAALREHGEGVVRAEVHDAGQCRAKSLARVAASWLDRFATWGEEATQEEEITPAIAGVTTNLVVRRPYGVCAQIIPFNAPLLMAVMKLGPALAAGNTVVLKPSELAPTPALELGRLIRAHTDIPPGVVNIVTGGAEVGATLVEDPRVAMIAFTGSTQVGEQIMSAAAKGARKVLLELGGKSAHIVLDDVKGREAARSAAFAAFLHQGQACIAGTRLLVPRQRHDEIVAELAEVVAGLAVGPAWDPAVQVGPMISRGQRDRALDYVADAVASGAELVAGGNVPDLPDELSGGAYVVPAVLAGVDPSSRVACEEVFGPVLAVSPYDDLDHAVQLANGTDMGLAAGVTGNDVEACVAVAKRLVAGTTWVNSWHHVHPEAPFGGFRASGVGREMGRYAIDEYSQLAHLHVHHDSAVPNPLMTDYFADQKGDER